MARIQFSKDAWWTASPDDYDRPLHNRVFEHVRALEDDQREIHTQNLFNCKLYTNRDLMSFEWNGNQSISFQPLNANLENVIQSVVETIVALIAKNRPKATPVARGADFDVYLRARQLDRFLWGEFVAQDIWTKGEMVFEDGCVYGTGVLKHDIDGREVYTERVHPDEIIVDQREGCEPNQMHQRKLVSRMWLMETYAKRNPELRECIAECQTQDFQYNGYRAPADEQILVVESWKLPTRPGASDGRHTICIEKATLVDEKYKRDWFPFTVFRWNPPQSGWYGRSLVEGLTGYQIRLNELNADIRTGQHVMCTPQIWMQQGAGIVSSQMDGTIGRVIKVRGEVPEPKVWNAFSPEIYNERDRVRAAAFEFAGVSQLSSQAKLPTQARLDSSEALREFSAIENERFARQAQAYEKFFLDVAKRLIALNAELYKSRDPETEVPRKQVYRSKYLVQQIDWSEVDLEADKYVLEISASSILNMSPAARKDKLNEWAASGTITQQEYKAWSGQPDLERMTDLMTAANDYAEYVVDKLLKGEEVTPDPLSDLQLTFRVVHDTYIHLRALECDEEDVLQGFRDTIAMIEKELNPPEDPMMQAAAPGPAMQATGMPGVVSDAGATAAMAPPEMMGDPSMMPPQEINPMTGAPAPSISGPAADAFLG